MSYFGISGPAQDGGFVQGIQLGAARLHNARVDRQRHAKSLGNVNKLIDQSSPETRIGGMVALVIIGGIAAYYLLPRRPAKGTKGAKSAMYAVFS